MAGKGPAGRITKPNQVGRATRKRFPNSLGCGPELPPLSRSPLPPQQGSGDAEAGECPRSQNMSTAQDGRRPGASEVRRGSFGGCRSLALPSAATNQLPIKKGRTATLRNAARPRRESVRPAPARALSRVLPKCPATLPGPRSSVGDRPPPYLFVVERCDPWLPFVELLLEVAVLQKHREAGSAWPPGGLGAPAPPPLNAGRARPAAARPNFPGPLPAHGRPCDVARSRLPVAAASLGQLPGRGGGRGHPAARPEPCKFAGRGAGASECEIVCRGRGDEQRAK